MSVFSSPSSRLSSTHTTVTHPSNLFSWIADFESMQDSNRDGFEDKSGMKTGDAMYDDRKKENEKGMNK